VLSLGAHGPFVDRLNHCTYGLADVLKFGTRIFDILAAWTTLKESAYLCFVGRYCRICLQRNV
jgi:hypothetical protein